MKFQLFSGLAVAAFAMIGASAAVGADLPTRKEAPAPMMMAPVPFSWTGFYIGVNAGAVWGTSSIDVTGTPEFQSLAAYGIVPGSLSGHSQAGFIGGGQAGYNFQTGNFVWGVETDFDGTSLSRSGSFTGAHLPYPLPYTTLTTSGSSRLDWLGTTRLRLGYAVDRLLIFGTGGLAYGGGSASGSVVADIAPSAVNWSGSTNSTRVGWTVGGGLEYAVTNNITLKGEYLYYNLGNENVSAYGNSGAVGLVGPNLYLQTKADINGSIARAGINWKF